MDDIKRCPRCGAEMRFRLGAFECDACEEIKAQQLLTEVKAQPLPYIEHEAIEESGDTAVVSESSVSRGFLMIGKVIVAVPLALISMCSILLLPIGILTLIATFGRRLWLKVAAAGFWGTISLAMILILLSPLSFILRFGRSAGDSVGDMYTLLGWVITLCIPLCLSMILVRDFWLCQRSYAVGDTSRSAGSSDSASEPVGRVQFTWIAVTLGTPLLITFGLLLVLADLAGNPPQGASETEMSLAIGLAYSLTVGLVILPSALVGLVHCGLCGAGISLGLWWQRIGKPKARQFTALCFGALVLFFLMAGWGYLLLHAQS